MTIPRNMRAAFIRKTGSVDEILVGELPVPCPGPTDVLVRMEASEANFVDLFVRSGAYQTHTPFPFIIGRDLVGAVAEIGSGVGRFSVGDKVWCNSLGHAGRQGAWAEYAVVSEDRLYPLPAGVDAKQAVAVLHAAATAHIGLVREAKLAAGETIFVEGGGGAVGSAVVQLATAMGARVIASDSQEGGDWCKSCGAEVVFDYHRKDLYEQVRVTTPEGVNVWWDTSGRNDFTHCLPLLAVGGRAVIMSGLSGASPVLPVGALYTHEITLHGFAISNATVTDLAAAAATINRLLAAGRLKTRIGATYNLADAVQAQADLESRKVRGRIVVVP